MTVSLGVLGPLHVEAAGDPVDVGGPREQALLCLLLARAGQTVSVDRLAEDLWEGDPPAGAARTVRAYVSRIRKALGEAGRRLVITEAPGYRLDVGEADVDLIRFEDLAGEARALLDGGRADAAADRFRDALALFRGTPFAQVSDTTWGRAESLRVEEARLAVLEARIEAELACGRHDRLVGELDGLCVEHPLREGLWAKRMVALYRAGRQAEALRAYQALRALLEEELGIEPSIELRNLETRILRHDPSLGTAPPLRGSPLPAGVVTFLFSDIEGSTKAWESDALAAAAMVRTHDATMRDAVEAHGGVVFKQTGDGTCAVFGDTIAALSAAIDAQRALATGSVSTRMAIHVGPATPEHGDYHGPPLNRTARLLGTAHGGQIVVSSAVRQLTVGALPGEALLVDLGEFHLPDIDGAERIHQVTHPGLRADFPPLRASVARRTNLPSDLTRFIGRVDERRRVVEALASHRVVTLTGVGGVGKTRLACATGESLVDEFPDGVWLCGLEAVRDRHAIDDLVAASLRISPRQGEPSRITLLDVIKDRRLLIVFDNCEHLLSAVAELAIALVDAGPQVRVLATSREGLGVRGEQIIPVPSMRQPEPGAGISAIEDAEAVQLFVERAKEIRPDFALDDDNAMSVASICARLDGVPLAIELAAARIGALSAQDISGRLDESFRLLTGSGRGAVDRHQALHRTIDWSYELLSEDERSLFAALSVFAGGFALEDAEALATSSPDGLGSLGALGSLDALDTLARLVQKSMVVAEPRGTSVRYRMLETIRQYAGDRLEDAGATAALRQWHADRYLGVVTYAAAMLAGPREADGVAILIREIANLRTALGWFVDQGQADSAAHLVAPLRYELFPSWLAREVGSWGATVVDRLEPEATVELERTYAAAAFWHWSNGDLEAAEVAADQAVDVARRSRRPLDPLAAYTVGTVAFHSGNMKLANRVVVDNPAANDDDDDPSIRAWVYSGRAARIGLADADLDRARPLAERGVALAERAGSPSILVFSTYILAVLTDHPGADRDPERALTLFRRAMSLDSPGADVWKLASRAVSGALLCELGQTAAGMSELRAALVDAERALSQVEVVSYMIGPAIYAFSRVGEHAIVAALGHAAQTGSLGWWWYGLNESARDRVFVKESRAQLDPDELRDAETLGASLDHDRAAELILATIARHTG